MKEDQKKDEKPEGCTCVEGGPVCGTCIERGRKAGIPEHTLKWMQLDQMERIRTVMF